ncbi:hypothetical protein ACFO1V_00050 [Daeguia caeni]|uniref:Transposase n=1 Tax=Daeguia caeni TaxID=439612 RepID=A0ABV9H1Y1_9HYPH
MKEVSLDHFERRSWQGLHLHVLMTMIAHAFLHIGIVRARLEKWKKNALGPSEPVFCLYPAVCHRRTLKPPP